MSELAGRRCRPCRGDTPSLPVTEVNRLRSELAAGWELDGRGHLTRTVKTPDFAHGLDLVNRIGALAEQEDHHPDLLLRWGAVSITLWTHVVGGLTENDFIVAAKIDRMLEEASEGNLE